MNTIPFPMNNTAAIIRLALKEDLGAGDVTASLVPADLAGKAVLLCKQDGIAAGLPLVRLIYRALDRRVKTRLLAEEGSKIRRGRPLAEISGPVRSLLTGERTALNFVCALSGIATLTRRYVDAVKGTRAGIYDTRKTAPGMRALAKYAVRMGGGFNHRMGLYDMVLVKDNHLAAKGIRDSIITAKNRFPRLPIEVEVEDLAQFKTAVQNRPDIIMLDNMDLRTMKKAVLIAEQSGYRGKLEASGGITLKNVRRTALTGVDRIAIGALTHSAPILDISMELRS